MASSVVFCVVGESASASEFSTPRAVINVPDADPTSRVSEFVQAIVGAAETSASSSQFDVQIDSVEMCSVTQPVNIAAAGVCAMSVAQTQEPRIQPLQDGDEVESLVMAVLLEAHVSIDPVGKLAAEGSQGKCWFGPSWNLALRAGLELPEAVKTLLDPGMPIDATSTSPPFCACGGEDLWTQAVGGDAPTLKLALPTASCSREDARKLDLAAVQAQNSGPFSFSVNKGGCRMMCLRHVNRHCAPTHRETRRPP